MAEVEVSSTRVHQLDSPGLSRRQSLSAYPSRFRGQVRLLFPPVEDLYLGRVVLASSIDDRGTFVVGGSWASTNKGQLVGGWRKQLIVNFGLALGCIDALEQQFEGVGVTLLGSKLVELRHPLRVVLPVDQRGIFDYSPLPFVFEVLLPLSVPIGVHGCRSRRVSRSIGSARSSQCNSDDHHKYNEHDPYPLHLHIKTRKRPQSGQRLRATTPKEGIK